MLTFKMAYCSLEHGNISVPISHNDMNWILLKYTKKVVLKDVQDGIS